LPEISSIVMAQVVVLMAALLLIAESQAGDLADRSTRQGFLSKSDYDKFITPNLNRVKHGNELGASPFTVVDDKPVLQSSAQAQEKQAADPISLSIFGIGLVSFVTMLGLTLRRALQPATIPANTVSALGGQVMEMKFQDSNGNVNSGRVGWGQLSSQSARPPTLCYAEDEEEKNIPEEKSTPDDRKIPDGKRRPSKNSTTWSKKKELIMEPVPLMPDVEGNWEPLVSEIWEDVEKMSKQAEMNFKSELGRFRDFCDNYKRNRGVITSNGRTLSTQTRLFDADYDDAGPIRKTQDHKWVRKLAKRVTPIVLEEYEKALNPTTTRSGSWATRKQITWSATQIMAVRPTPWDAPVVAAEEEEKTDPKAGMDEAAKDAAATAEEMSAGDGDLPARSSTPPQEEMITSEPEPPLDPTQYQQLMLQQVSPLKTGVLRFPRTMKTLGRYEATSPPPRHVIISRLPPGCSTDPRCDLQNYLLTTHIPLKGSGSLTCGSESVEYEVGKPIVFDSMHQYSMKNTGSEDLLLLHVDFWHPDVTEDEKQMLAYFWIVWQKDQYHPSMRARYTRRENSLKDLERREKEERRKKIKGSDKKDGGGGGGSIVRQ
jgi:hypothetical protein